MCVHPLSQERALGPLELQLSDKGVDVGSASMCSRGMNQGTVLLVIMIKFQIMNTLQLLYLQRLSSRPRNSGQPTNQLAYSHIRAQNGLGTARLCL